MSSLTKTSAQEPASADAATSVPTSAVTTTSTTGNGKQIDLADDDDKWAHAQVAYEMLKNKIAAASVLDTLNQTELR
ncbi:hypothetical protein PC118_g20574 [Phytophthora cactorum]|uniref:Uncharacterized protein n=1 Tax=Phytophthora cactorum TaxID=29920 RepID=A0A8T1EY96_9STRA|nr:hypothetical protein PC118_g20574 [Phytophthora cactorum]